MRFSLKWGLLGMAYVAVVTAALTQDHWAYADLLWLATFLAVCVSILTAILGGGSRRATAIGFALFACGFAVCAQFAPQSIPTRRILLAAGFPEYQAYQQNQAYQPAPVIFSSPQPLSLSVSPPTISAYPMPAQAVPAPMLPTPIAAFAVSPVELPFISKVRATNSISSMLLGLVGAWLAAAAYRRHRAGSENSVA